MDSIKGIISLPQAGFTREITVPARLNEEPKEQQDLVRPGITSEGLPDTRQLALKAGALNKAAAPHVGLLDLVPDLSYLSTLGIALTLVTGGAGMAGPAEAYTPQQQTSVIERTLISDTPALPSRYQYSRPDAAYPLNTPHVNWTPDMKVIPMFDQIDMPPGMELPPMDLPPGVELPQFPTSLQGLSDSSFIEQMVRAKQEALRRAAQAGALNPSQNNNNQSNQGAKGTLTVNAHGYEEGGVYHPVNDIRITEYGNYKNRTHESYTNYGHNPEQSLSLDSAKNGQWYNVTVTWEGGESRTYQVKMDSNDGSQSFSAYR